MNILFDIAHPAHFHLFKNTINELTTNNQKVIITVRNRDVLTNLLDHHQLEYHILSKTRQGFSGLFLELLIRDIQMFRICKRYNPILLVGSTPNIAHIGRLTGIPSHVFSEDDDPTVPLFSLLTYPFATKIINPNCLKYNKWGGKRLLHNSYHELAYLHPDNFIPDKHILEKYGLKEKQYVIARFSALQAHHDVGERGISRELWNRIENLIKNYQIIKSIENEKPNIIDPWDMHHILAFAKMIISDSQTMTIEGAVLGVPAVRINTFIGKSTVIEELENTYKLAFGILPSQGNIALNTIEHILENKETESVWEDRKQSMLAEKIDLNKWILDLIHKEILK